MYHYTNYIDKHIVDTKVTKVTKETKETNINE